MNIVRRLFVVPLADGSHGKSTILGSLLSQALGEKSPQRKGVRQLISPAGRLINSYVFVRSYQETEKRIHKSVAKALGASDFDWKKRELIILPSHVQGATKDIDEMIAAAHSAGFDVISAAVLLDTDKRAHLSRIWLKNWDERWTLPNPETSVNLKPQLNSLGVDLWTLICNSLTH